MENRKKFYFDESKTDSYTVPTDKEEIRKNLIHFYDVCNQIFSDKQKYKELFYTNEEIKELKNNPQKCKNEGIEFI